MSVQLVQGKQRLLSIFMIVTKWSGSLPIQRGHRVQMNWMGVDYHFETPASMNRLHLLESVEYDHHLYGSSLESLITGWQTGHDDVIVLDTKGAFAYYQKLGDRAIIIFLTVSHIASLAHRMVKRGDELRAVHSRLKSPEYHRDLHLPDELKGIANVVVNDSWTQTTTQIDRIVRQISSEND